MKKHPTYRLTRVIKPGNVGYRVAAAVIATIPTIIVYLLAQRWFVRGITMSGFGGRWGESCSGSRV